MINTTDLMNIILAVFVVLGFIISIYFFIARKILMASTMGVMFLSSSIATLMYALQISTTPLSGLFIFVVIRYVVLAVFVFTLALFVFNFTQTPIKFYSRQFFWLAATPAVLLLFLALNPRAPWLYFNMQRLTLTEIFMIDGLIAPAYFILHVYMIGLLILLFFLLFRGFKLKPKLNRINTLIIASGLFLYLFTHLLHLSGARLLGSYSINMLTYSPVALLALLAYRRYRLADIRPLAYNTIFNQMQDGILVVDRSGYLVDFNPAAREYVGSYDDLMIGRPLDIPDLEISQYTEEQNPHAMRAIRREFDGSPCLINVSSLSGLDGDIDGFLISIRDISKEIEAEKLKETEIIRKGAWEERVRLARGLHDSTLQNVGSLIMLSGAISQSLVDHPSEETNQLLETLQTGANLAYEDLRSFINELQIDDVLAEKPFDFRKSLEAKLCYFRQQEKSLIKFEMPKELPIDSQKQRELFYIILEAVNNAVRHASADTITTCVRVNPDSVVVEVCDDGCGFDQEKLTQYGMGLKNIHSRTSQLNGMLSIISRPAEGTKVKVEISYNPESADQMINRLNDE